MRFSVLIVAGVFLQTLFGQSSGGYFEQFIQRLKRTKTAEAQLVIDTLEYLLPAVDPSQREKVAAMLKLLEEKRVPLKPYTYAYIWACISFWSGRHSFQSDFFNHWHKFVEEYVAALSPKNRPRLLAYLNFLKNMFSEGALYKSPSVTWVVHISEFRVRWKEKPVSLEIFIPKTTLTGITVNDTTHLSEVSGFYDPYTNEFSVKRGAKVFWSEYPPDKVYVELGSFTINLKKAGYSVDTAYYVNKYLFNKKLTGRFIDRLVPRTAPKEKLEELKKHDVYPQFLSYDNDLTIYVTDLIEFRGGVSIKGERVYGYYPEEEGSAIMVVYKNKKEKKLGKELMVLESNQFRIEPEKMVLSRRCRVRIRLTDSHYIYHPSVFLRIDLQKGKITLRRGDQGLSAAPFQDTYHQVEFYPELLGWRIGSDTLTLGVQRGVGKLRVPVVSLSYFDEALYDSYMKVTDYHPLGKLGLYVMKTGFYTLSDEEVAHIWNPRLSV